MQPVVPQIIDYQSVVEQLCNRHGWGLLDRAEFSAQLAVRAQSTSPPDVESLTKLAVNLYCEILHAACGSSGDRRQRAYTELAHYLYDHALQKYRDPDLAHEITHDAIILVHEQLANCHNPGAFLAFALLKVWNAATATFRRRDRHAKRATPLLVDDGEQGGREPVDQQTPAPEALAVTTEQQQRLMMRFDHLIEAAPRAEKQIQAVLLKFLYNYSDEEIGDQLATEVANVHVLRSRGLKRLREDPVLRQLALEMA